MQAMKHREKKTDVTSKGESRKARKRLSCNGASSVSILKGKSMRFKKRTCMDTNKEGKDILDMGLSFSHLRI